MKKLKTPFVSKNIRYEPRQCEKHGEYLATGLSPFTADRWSRCPVCREEDEAAKAEAEEEAKRLHGFEANLRAAGLEARFLDKSFENFYPQNDPQRKILEIVMAYADNFLQHKKDGRCLGFLGDVGTGKTHLAISLVRQVIIAGHTARYVRVYDMFSAIKDSWDYGYRQRSEAEVLEDYIHPDLLVIDEIGVQFLSQAEMILMYKIVEGRYGRKNPTAIISNLPKPPDSKKNDDPGLQADLKNKANLNVRDAMGFRSYDRLYEGEGIILEFRGTSYRRRDISPANNLQHPLQ